MAINAKILDNGYLAQSKDALSAYVHSRIVEEFPFLQQNAEAKVVLRTLIYDLATKRRDPKYAVAWLAQNFADKSLYDQAYLPIENPEDPAYGRTYNMFKLLLADIYQFIRGMEEDEQAEYLKRFESFGIYDSMSRLLANFVYFDLIILKMLSYFYPQVDFKEAAPVVLSQEQVDYLRAALQTYLEQNIPLVNDKGLQLNTEVIFKYFAKHPTELFKSPDPE
ncbi:hypothetical protein [Psittacicella hinzii]|uniref:Uncharacterized protein n=1 Tax=Psittacicella hinzii TaxID=2028575 RepID=A0A3A1YLZ7_9GAMM|nr:hypothetical protein [Psittacicella hinzii]RIY39313.1 hypothetical protein CKF58_02410 [Psittacicella hinzii]